MTCCRNACAHMCHTHAGGRRGRWQGRTEARVGIGSLQPKTENRVVWAAGLCSGSGTVWKALSSGAGMLLFGEVSEQM